MSSLTAPWQTWPVQKITHRTTQKHVQHHDATDIWKKHHFLCFWVTSHNYCNYFMDNNKSRKLILPLMEFEQNMSSQQNKTKDTNAELTRHLHVILTLNVNVTMFSYITNCIICYEITWNYFGKTTISWDVHNFFSELLCISFIHTIVLCKVIALSLLWNRAITGCANNAKH